MNIQRSGINLLGCEPKHKHKSIECITKASNTNNHDFGSVVIIIYFRYNA